MKHRLHTQQGQVLIQVAVVVVLLLAFVGLTIDVGQVYFERRHMQNAADGGSLAGAHELCFGSGDWDQAETEAKYYAEERNEAVKADVTFEGPDDNIVVVTTHITPTTFFGEILGIERVHVVARAKAACGVTINACGLWPVAFKQSSWDSIKDQCGREFALFADGQQSGSGDNIEKVDCTVYNCNVFPQDTYPDPTTNPPTPEEEWDLLQGDDRAWLDFTAALAPYQDEADCDDGEGCGTNELKCWIEHDSGAPIRVGDCVGGDSGVKAGAKNAVDSRKDDIIRFPTFNEKCGEGSTGCTGEYRVSGFGCAQVIGWIQKLTIEPIDPNSNDPNIHAKVVHVKVACDDIKCNTNCGRTDGSGGLPGPGESGSVSLID